MATGPVMELQKIRELIDVFKASDLAEFEFVEGEHRVRFVKRGGSSGLGVDTLQPEAPAGVDSHVRSPLFGVIHLTPSPDAPPFVKPGDVVQQGQVVCIVEAMKIFHEIKAPRNSRIDKVLVSSAEEVESGALLMSLVDTN